MFAEDTMMRTIFSVTLVMSMMVAGATARAGEGTLSKDAIREVVRANLEDVRVCYNKVLAVEPTATANLIVDFTIGGDGAVTQSKVGSITGPAELGTCVAATVAAWKFPKPTGGAVSVSYPFLFEPG